MFNIDSFRGGVHPLKRQHEGKAHTNHTPIQDLPHQEMLIIPMAQSAGTTCNPLVKKGERVLRGQKIGEPRGFVGACVHAPSSGTVLAVAQREIMGGVFCDCVLLQCDEQDEEIPALPSLPLDAPIADMVGRVRESGIVGMGGAAFPTHIKFTPPAGKTVDTVLLNGSECEPYITADHQVMLESAQDIVLGLRYAMRMLEAKRGIIAIERNKPDALLAMQRAIAGIEGLSVRALRSKYPQGSEKQLISATTSRQVPSGGLPADAGCVVINVATAAAVAIALRDGKPLIQRMVTVTGNVPSPANYRVRIGTSAHALLEQSGGLKEDTAKLISGGPMMGMALFSQDMPIVKATSCLLALSADDIDPGAPTTACIRCGRCSFVCPIRLLPMKINTASAHQVWDDCKKLNALDCIECGACNFACPAKIDILSGIRISKRVLITRLKK